MPETIIEQINTRMKDAMKRKDARELALLRMVKSRFQVKLTEKGVVGPLTDEMAINEIAAYSKQQQKALPDFERAGERAKDKVEQIHYEIAYLDPFLPKLLDEAATATIVDEVIAQTGAKAPNETGKVMGAIMGRHKGNVDPALVKKLVGQKLGG